MCLRAFGKILLHGLEFMQRYLLRYQQQKLILVPGTQQLVNLLLIKAKIHLFKNKTTRDKINFTAVVKTFQMFIILKRFISLTTGDEKSFTDKWKNYITFFFKVLKKAAECWVKKV